MVLTLPLILVLIGLILWATPFTGSAAFLREVGKWTYIVALAAWLWH
jgi:hypothetical protein